MSSLFATGYIHNLIDKNQTLREFALSCAGDDYPDGEDTVTHHREKLKEAKAELQRLVSMSAEDRERHGVQVRTSEIVEWEAIQRNHNDEVAKVRAMLPQVRDWAPPTPEHAELKDMMLRQIAEQLEREDRGDYYEDKLNAMRFNDAASHFENELSNARSTVAYHAKKLREVEERLAAQRAFLQALRDSLPG